MLPTYPATLRNGQIEWGSEGAPPIPPNESVPVRVMVLNRTSPDRNALAAALDALAASGVAEKFGDPVEWQIEERKDRPLPGREE